jgi:hypothetical protein
MAPTIIHSIGGAVPSGYSRVKRFHSFTVGDAITGAPQ